MQLRCVYTLSPVVDLQEKSQLGTNSSTFVRIQIEKGSGVGSVLHVGSLVSFYFVSVELDF